MYSFTMVSAPSLYAYIFEVQTVFLFLFNMDIKSECNTSDILIPVDKTLAAGL